MEKYIGTKELLAEPMTRGAYNQLRGWTMLSNENPDDEGYLVEYLNSPNPNHPDYSYYISWSPKDVFERSYRLNGFATYGQVIEALKVGKTACRTGWNGTGMFIFKQVPANVKIQYVPNMQSLPDNVKDEFVKRGLDLNYSNQICIVKLDNTIDSWVASSSDTFAEDWIILD